MISVMEGDSQTTTSVGHAYYKYYVFVRPERLKSGWKEPGDGSDQRPGHPVL